MYGDRGHAGSSLNPGAMGGPRQVVQTGLSSSETALQSTCWGLPLGPDDPPSGPQLAGPWPLAWHPLWAALGGQGRPLLTQAAHRAPPAALRVPALSRVCVCLGKGTWSIPSWWSGALSRARLGPLRSGGGGREWGAGWLECAAGARLRCQACMSGGVQGLLLDEAVPSQLLTAQAAGPLGAHLGLALPGGVSQVEPGGGSQVT